MKTILLIINMLLTTIIIAQDFKVMTYNIRYDNPWDTINSWEQRRQSVFKIIEESSADIFGVQEALNHQVEDLQKAFPAFEYVGVGRDDGKTKGEYAAIFYRKTKFEVIKKGTFWLSETPERPSVGWDASMERICTFVNLIHKESSETFWVFNAHYDHIGVEARINSTALLLEKMNQLSDSQGPIIIMGDLNAEAPEATITQFKEEKLIDISNSSSDSRIYQLGTFNGFQKEFEAKKIDYIFTRNIFPKSYQQIFDTMPNGNYPSDHFPVMVGIDFK